MQTSQLVTPRIDFFDDRPTNAKEIFSVDRG